MKKMLEEKIQKDLLKDFTFIIKNTNGRYIVNNEINSITYFSNSDNNIRFKTSIYDNEGNIMFFISRFGNYKYIYDTINGKKLITKKLHINSFIDSNDNVYEYKYNKNGKDIETILNGEVISKYEYYENGKLKSIESFKCDHKLKYEYDDNYTIVYKNDILNRKFNDTENIYIKEGFEEERYLKEFNDKNQLIKYTTPKYNITYSYDEHDRLCEVKVNETIYKITYTDIDVLVLIQK